MLNKLADFLDVLSDYLLIRIHQEFVLYAIDDYLYRLTPETLEGAVFDLYTLFGLNDDINSLKYASYAYIFKNIPSKKYFTAPPLSKERLLCYNIFLSVG